MKTISYAVLAGLLIIPHVSFAQAGGFVDAQENVDYKLIKLQRELTSLSERGSSLEKLINDVDEKHGDAAAEVLKEDNTSEITVETKSGTSSATSKDKTVTPKKEIIPEEVPLPKPAIKKYNPQKEQSGKSGGRRPFIRSDVSTDGQQIYYASIAESEVLEFADESEGSSGNYSGYNDNNVYVLPDAYAVNCELTANQATESGKMSACLESMLKDKASSNQSAKDHATEVIGAGVYQETKEAVAAGVRLKNVAGNFETETLDPLQKKSSEATDERSDFETLTFTDMEAVKTKYRLIEVYASMLKLQALKNLNDFELATQEFTDIDAKSGASE